MAVNAPEVQVLSDSDSTVIVKVTGQYNAATTQNTKIFTANTVVGANTSKPACLLNVEKVQFDVSIANAGFIALEFVSTVNANSRIYNLGGGGARAGVLAAYVPNNANTPSGDFNLAQVGLANNDTYSLIIHLRKVTDGQFGAAFANLFSGYNR